LKSYQTHFDIARNTIWVANEMGEAIMGNLRFRLSFPNGVNVNVYKKQHSLQLTPLWVGLKTS